MTMSFIRRIVIALLATSVLSAAAVSLRQARHDSRALPELRRGQGGRRLCPRLVVQSEFLEGEYSGVRQSIARDCYRPARPRRERQAAGYLFDGSVRAGD